MSHSLNFLHGVEPEALKGKRKRRKTLRTLFVSILVFFVVWLVVLLVAAGQLSVSVGVAQRGLLQAKQQAESFSFDDAQQTLQGVQNDLSEASSRLMILRTASWLPGIGPSIVSTTALIETTGDIAGALQPIFDLGQDLMQLAGLSQEYLHDVSDGLSDQVTFDDLSSQTKRAILLRLAGSASDIDLLSAQVGIALSEIELLEQELPVASLQALIQPIALELMELASDLEMISVATRLLPSFGGLEEPATTLVLFLNNSELRPGGGFIGSYGVMVTDGGDIDTFETADVYAIDNAVAAQVTLAPPEPLALYNAASTWFFRDSNWSPDFAESSRFSVERFLKESSFLDATSSVPSAASIDHVFALTPTFASKLLEITGPIEVGGQLFTAENIPDAIEYQVQIGFKDHGIPVNQRKEILADLVDEMKSRMYQLSYVQIQQVLQVAQEGLKTKQVLLYSTEDSVQEIIERAQWGGVVEPSVVDTLMVVDANLAALKTDPVVEREIEYAIDHNDYAGEWWGSLKVTYNHTGSFDYKTTRYRTYVRAYVPEGSRFVRALQESVEIEGMEVVEDLGLLSFGTFLSIEPGTQQTITYQFALSSDVVAAIESGNYQLNVIKQAGAGDYSLTLDLNFGKQVAQATPAEERIQWGDTRYRLNTILDQDLDFTIEL